MHRPMNNSFYCVGRRIPQSVEMEAISFWENEIYFEREIGLKKGYITLRPRNHNLAGEDDVVPFDAYEPFDRIYVNELNEPSDIRPSHSSETVYRSNEHRNMATFELFRAFYTTIEPSEHDDIYG